MIWHLALKSRRDVAVEKLIKLYFNAGFSNEEISLAQIHNVILSIRTLKWQTPPTIFSNLVCVFR